MAATLTTVVATIMNRPIGLQRPQDRKPAGARFRTHAEILPVTADLVEASPGQPRRSRNAPGCLAPASALAHQSFDLGECRRESIAFVFGTVNGVGDGPRPRPQA